MPDDLLQGRRILVVGGSSGIGRATALLAAHSGATVAVSARRKTELAEVASKGGPLIEAFPVDVRNPDEIGSMVKKAVGWLGGLDTIVYAAGRAVLEPFALTSSDAWQETFAVNVTGAAITVAQCLPHLINSDKTATVALLSSHSVGDPWPGLVAYGASKAALGELARGVANEHASLRVLDIVVGNTATGFGDRWDPKVMDASLRSWFEGGYLRHDVLGANDVAARIVHVLADETVTGQVRIVGPESTPSH